MSEAFCKPLVLPKPADFSLEMKKAHMYLDFWRDRLAALRDQQDSDTGNVTLNSIEFDTMLWMMNDVDGVLYDIDKNLYDGVLPAWREAQSDLEARGVILDV